MSCGYKMCFAAPHALVVYLELRQRVFTVLWLQNSFSSPTTELTALPNPLAVFEGPLGDVGEREGKREGRKRMEGMEKAPLK